MVASTYIQGCIFLKPEMYTIMWFIYLVVAIAGFWVYAKYFSSNVTRECVSPECWPVSPNYYNRREAARTLQRLNSRMMLFFEILRRKYHISESEDTIAEEGAAHTAGYTQKQKAHIEHLLRGYNYEVVYENDPTTSKNTSYTISKGAAMHLCLRHKDNPDGIIDEHTLFFVLLHEVAHIANYASIGHMPEFWEVFKFILGEAREAGVHEPADYSKAPVMYCGLHVDYSPYWDPAVASI
jgi:WLM domain